MGFENRTSFMVVTEPSEFAGIPISVKSQGPDGVLLTTPSYDILLNGTISPPIPAPTCSAPVAGYDVNTPTSARADKFPDGTKVDDEAGCCDACTSDSSCNMWVYAPPSASDSQDVPGANCWPLKSIQSTRPAADRTFGCGPNSKCDAPDTPVKLPHVVVTSPAGDLLYNSSADSAGRQAQCSGTNPDDCNDPCFWDKDANECTNVAAASNLLHWPSPTSAKAYALVDYPRFYVPAWGTAPIPNDTKVRSNGSRLHCHCRKKCSPSLTDRGCLLARSILLSFPPTGTTFATM